MMDFSWRSGSCGEPDFLQGKEGRFWNKLRQRRFIGVQIGNEDQCLLNTSCRKLASFFLWKLT